jgi:hypothetical protein
MLKLFNAFSSPAAVIFWWLGPTPIVVLESAVGTTTLTLPKVVMGACLLEYRTIKLVDVR